MFTHLFELFGLLLALLPAGAVVFLPALLPFLPAGVAAFLVTDFGRRVFEFAAIVLTLLLGWWLVSTHYYNQGWDAHAEDERARNLDGINRANNEDQRRTDCLALGYTWDAVGRRCVK